MSDGVAMVFWVSVAGAVAVVFAMTVIGAADAVDRRTDGSVVDDRRSGPLAWTRRAVRLVASVAALAVALMPLTAIVGWLLDRG